MAELLHSWRSSLDCGDSTVSTDTKTQINSQLPAALSVRKCPRGNYPKLVTTLCICDSHVMYNVTGIPSRSLKQNKHIGGL